MSIRCGTCKDRHETVAQVRACTGATKAPSAPVRQPATEGMYVVNGVIYKVKRAIYGSRRLYAVALRGQEWAMEPGMVNNLRPEDRMTLEAAKAYGDLYGRCVRCQADLTDEASIARGLGPVCATKI